MGKGPRSRALTIVIDKSYLVIAHHPALVSTPRKTKCWTVDVYILDRCQYSLTSARDCRGSLHHLAEEISVANPGTSAGVVVAELTSVSILLLGLLILDASVLALCCFEIVRYSSFSSLSSGLVAVTAAVEARSLR